MIRWSIIDDAASLQKAWPLAVPFLREALARANGEYTLESIAGCCMEGSMHLWMIAEDEENEVKAALVTHFNDFPGRRVLTVLLAGGKEMNRWIELEPVLEAFARTNGASQIRLYGRKGWEKALKPHGFDKEFVVLFKDLETLH